MNLFKITKERYAQSEALQKISHNIGWLFFDKILRMGVGLLVGVWIARYLGPEQFGLWNYAVAFTSLFGVFATLGLDSIVVRDIVRDPSHRDEILGSSFFLRLIAGITTLFLTIIFIYFIKSGDRLTLYLVALSSIGFVFQSINVIDFYFQSQILSKYTVVAQNGAFVLITLVKVGLLFFKAPLIAFAITGSVEIALGSLFLVVAYKLHHLSICAWRFNFDVAKRSLKDSWPLILAGFAVMVYMRIDQVMIGQLMGNQAVGLYSAAVKISEIWYFIPLAISSSIFPSLIESRKINRKLYHDRLQKLFSLMMLFSFSIAIATSIFGSFIVTVLFGPEYTQSTPVLIILVWTGIAVCLGVASSSWLNIENLQRYSLFRTGIGCVVNVILNLILIPRFGINGAAIATLVSYFIATFSVVFSKKTRVLGLMMFKSMNLFHVFKHRR